MMFVWRAAAEAARCAVAVSSFVGCRSFPREREYIWKKIKRSCSNHLPQPQSSGFTEWPYGLRGLGRLILLDPLFDFYCFVFPQHIHRPFSINAQDALRYQSTWTHLCRMYILLKAPYLYICYFQIFTFHPRLQSNIITQLIIPPKTLYRSPEKGVFSLLFTTCGKKTPGFSFWLRVLSRTWERYLWDVSSHLWHHKRGL